MAPSLGLLALLAVTQAAPAASPPAAAVKGFVLDAESSAPLSGAGVTLADLNRSVTTDATGRYSFEGVPAGPQHLTVHRLGYNTRTLHLLVPSTGRLHFDVSLGPRPIKLAGISVSPVPTVRGQDGTGLTAWPDRGLTQASLVNHPTLPQKDAFLALSGGEVWVEPEVPTGVHLRGGASDHTGYVLDGIPVLGPYHSAGTFGAWNPDALADITIFGAAPSPGLPDALAGIVSAHTLEPAPRLRFQGTMSNSEARVTVDGPLAGSASLVLGWRSGLSTTWSSKDEASYLDGQSGDLLAKVTTPLFGGGLRLLWYESEDELSAARTVPEDGAAPTRNQFEWAGRSLGVSWSSAPMADRTSWTVSAWRAEADAGAYWFGGEGGSVLASGRRDHGVTAMMEIRDETSETEMGFRVRAVSTDYGVVRAEDGSTIQDLRGSATIWTGFVEHGRRVLESLHAWAGASAAFERGTPRFAPRVRLLWQPGSGVALTAAYSRTHQFAQSLRNSESLVGPVFPADLWVGAGTDGVPVPRGNQVVLAGELHPRSGLRIGAQVFQRWLEGLILVAPVERGPFATTSFATGGGSARGVSLDLSAGGARYGLVASYGLQRISVSGEGTSYVPRYGATHTAEAGVVFFPGATSSLRLSVSGATGRTATAFSGPLEWERCNLVDQGCEFAGSPELDGQRGGVHLPGYIRVDLGARKHWHLAVGGWDVRLAVWGTITNVLGRYNVLAYAPEPETGERHPVGMLPRTPLVVGIDIRY